MSPDANPDLTVLGIVFGTNVGFSAVDSLVGDLLRSLKRNTGKRIEKYRDAKWIAGIAPTDTAKDATKRTLLANVIKKAIGYADQADNLFRVNVVVWKSIMAAAAATAFVFMAIPFAPRWSALLVLPVPFCFGSCLIELWVFHHRLNKKCADVESMRENILETEANPDGEADDKSVEARLSALEALQAAPRQFSRPSPPRRWRP